MKIREAKIENHLKDFSEQEQEAILEKLKHLQKYVDGISTLQELAEINIQRRLEWLNQNKYILDNYSNLTLPEKVHHALFLEHMKIDPKHSVVEKMSENKIRIESHNFCPYLEACKILDLDTKIICKEFGEPSFCKFVETVDPNLKFSRDYNKIRPYHHYCEEFIELII